MHSNDQKRLKKAKKGFWPAFGCTQHPKAGRNTQQKLMRIGNNHEGSEKEII